MQSASPAVDAAQVAGACIEWGPFDEADLQRARNAAEEVDVRVEPLRHPLDPKGFMVYVPPAPDSQAARARAAELRRAGVDAYVLLDGPFRWGASLGVFRQEQGAQALLQRVRQRGVSDAQVVARGPGRWTLRLHAAQALSAERRGALSAAFPTQAFHACSA